MVADTLHQDMYLYDIYSEYLSRIKHYSTNSNINSLSIRYYRVNIPKSRGIEPDLSMITIDQYSLTYDIFDFVPVLESSPLSYSTENDEDSQGLIRKTQGTMTIMAVEEPLPGDIFNFYQNGSTNEFFTVEDVNFTQSVKDLNIYQISFVTANVYKSSIENLPISNHFYYVSEFKKFYDKTLYNDYVNLLTNRDAMIREINTYYDSQRCCYTDLNMTGDMELLANSMLMFLNGIVRLTINVIIGYSIKLETDGYAIRIVENNCWINNLNNFREDIPLMFRIKELQDLYFKFILYTEPVPAQMKNPNTLANHSTGLTIIKDLDGNSIQ